MASEGNVPEVRFDGFVEPWEVRYLGDESEIHAGGDVNNTILKNSGKYPVIANALTNNGILGYYQNEYRIEAPAVTVTGRGDVGHAQARKTNFTPVVRLLALKSKHNVDFLANAINMHGVMIESTGVPQLTTPQLAKYRLYFPELPEQIAIGNFFSNLDNTIALKKQQYEQTINIKKSMLEKMFPKKGADIPEIRFNEFTEPWTVSKLGDLAYFRRGSFPQPYGRAEWYDGEDSMPFVQVVDVAFNLALVDNTKQQISALAQPKSVFVPKGSVVVTLQGSIGRVALTQYDSYVDRTLLIFEGYKADICKQFWAYIVQELFDREKRVAPGGTIKTITKDALTGFEVKIPSLPEQTAIGNFFHNLDTLIASRQQELKKLQNIKKACLSKMFV